MLQSYVNALLNEDIGSGDRSDRKDKRYQRFPQQYTSRYTTRYPEEDEYDFVAGRSFNSRYQQSRFVPEDDYDFVRERSPTMASRYRQRFRGGAGAGGGGLGDEDDEEFDEIDGGVGRSKRGSFQGAIPQSTWKKPQGYFDRRRQGLISTKSSADSFEPTEKNLLVKDLVADKQRDEFKANILMELINSRRRHSASLDLCAALGGGKKMPSQEEITQVIQEDVAVDMAIFDLVEELLENLTTRRKADKIVRALSLGRPYQQSRRQTLEDDAEDMKFDDTFYKLARSLMDPGAGNKLVEAGALNNIRTHDTGFGGESSGKPPAPSPGDKNQPARPSAPKNA